VGIWIDTPSWHPASQLLARGVEGVIRYLCMPYNTGPGSTMPNKRLERAELDQKLAAGIDVAVNWEDAADDALGGYARGLDKGRRAGDWMLNVLDWPAGGVCASSIDFDIGGWAGSAPQAYQYGWRDGLTSEGPYHPAIYGDTQALDGAAADGTAVVFWWSVAKGWSSGIRPRTVHVDQNGYWQWDNSADLDTILIRPFGSYLHPLGGDDPVTPAEMDTIVKRVLAGVDHRLVRAVAYLVGAAPNGNAYVNDAYDIPAEGAFGPAVDAWSWFNDPKSIDLGDLAKNILLVLRGDTDANGQPLPPGKNTHPANVTFIYDAVKGGPTSTAAILAALTAIDANTDAALDDEPKILAAIAALGTINFPVEEIPALGDAIADSLGVVVDTDKIANAVRLDIGAALTGAPNVAPTPPA